MKYDKHIVLGWLWLSPFMGYGQFEKSQFETDSTAVELIRNSVYHIKEEVYKLKDSVFYSVSYIEDTTQLHIEGWKRKNGQYFGEWSEYKLDGTWLYTIDYTNHAWDYNKDEFLFQALKDSMKIRADNILIHKFGQAFFEKNVVFNFHGHTYIGKWTTYENGTFWTQDKYLGAWIQPISQKPNTYVLDYTIQLAANELYDNILRIELDSTGNLIDEPSKFEVRFEGIVAPQAGEMTISRDKAIQMSRANELISSERNTFQTSLRFGWRKMAEYPGEFYYEVLQQYDESIDGDCRPNCTETKFFNVWRFNPWTSELLFKSPMKQITRWSNGCGDTGNYLELK